MLLVTHIYTVVYIVLHTIHSIFFNQSLSFGLILLHLYIYNIKYTIKINLPENSKQNVQTAFELSTLNLVLLYCIKIWAMTFCTPLSHVCIEHLPPTQHCWEAVELESIISALRWDNYTSWSSFLSSNLQQISPLSACYSDVRAESNKQHAV